MAVAHPIPPATLGRWLILLVVLVCIVLQILMLAGVLGGEPVWLPYALLALVGIGCLLG